MLFLAGFPLLATGCPLERVIPVNGVLRGGGTGWGVPGKVVGVVVRHGIVFLIVIIFSVVGPIPFFVMGGRRLEIWTSGVSVRESSTSNSVVGHAVSPLSLAAWTFFLLFHDIIGGGDGTHSFLFVVGVVPVKHHLVRDRDARYCLLLLLPTSPSSTTSCATETPYPWLLCSR